MGMDRFAQNILLNGSELENEKKYWLTKLNGETGISKLPYDYVPIRNQFETAVVSYRLKEGVTRKIIEMGRNSELAVYLILLTGIKFLLSKYTGSEEITVMMPAFQRNGGDEFLSNFLPLKTRVEKESTFREFLLEVRKTLTEADEYRNFPMGKIVELLNAAGNDSKKPLFNTVVLLENLHERKYLEDADTDMTLSFRVKDHVIEADVEYNTFLFRKESVDKLIVHLENFFFSVTKNTDIKLSELDVLTEEERRRILYDFNNTKCEYPKHKTIHSIFEEQVRKTPENTAVIFGNNRLTYIELNTKSNLLARQLRTKGVGAGNVKQSIVAVMVERSFEMVIGIMGILKAGGAYLPISPSYPAQRIQYMIEDSGAAVLLTQSQFMNIDGFDGEIINLEDDALYAGDGSNLTDNGTSRNLAYVIYTSGSTGKPKGAMIEHYSLVNRIHWMQKQYMLGESDVILQKTPYTFDVSVWELFWWSICGSAVCLLEPGAEKDPEEIIETIYKHHVSTIHFVPSMLNAFLEYAIDNNAASKTESLRRVFASGEALSKHAVMKFKGIFNGKNAPVLYNLYGPTEATVDVTCFECTQIEEISSIPIGKPIDNTGIYILDRFMKLQPPGIPGELCVVGDGVARGYLNRPELSSEKFIPSPFVNQYDYEYWNPNMYRTGDLAKWLPGGNIEFLGRLDHQVKIRGFRIEIGEIESAILSHHDVKEALVMAREDGSIGKYLCAYYVSGNGVTASELKRFLGEKLPDYMVPSYLIQLSRMPLSPNGKVDRKALQDPKESINKRLEYVAPTNEKEIKLAGIFEEILGVGKVSIDDSFFEIGGHSLKATILASRIHKEFNARISLQEIFKAPTVRKLANILETAKKDMYSHIQPAEEKEYYELSAAQKRLFVIDLLEGAQTAYNIPGGIIIRGVLDVKLVEAAFNQMIQRHETLRTSFEMVNGEPRQRVHRDAGFTLGYMEIEDGYDVEDEISRINSIANEFIRPFVLDTLPLIRAMLIRLREDRYALIYDMHHIISDGISMNILFREFIKLYQGENLPEMRIQYKDFSEWRNALGRTEAIREQEEYWRSVFSKEQGEIPVLNMPVDYPRPSVQSFEGGTISFEFDAELTESLLALCSKTGSTMFMGLLAIYYILLSRYTGQDDIIVGVPVAGRPHSDLESIIGVFINTLAMRNHPKSDKTFYHFLIEVKENALKAFENQDYPFEELVEKIEIKRDLGRNPLFDTMLVLHNFDMHPIQDESLSFMPLELDNRTSKFDLTLHAVQADNKLFFRIEYLTKLFKRETIEKLAGHFINLARVTVDNPQTEISRLEILSKEEKHELLHIFNDSETEYPKDKTIADIFEEQVKKTSDRTALVFEGKKLTYGELNKRANKLAVLLRNNGVEQGTIAAIMMERSIEMVIGILAVLKAGGAYLPIDPEYPADRIRFMLQDSKALVLLTENDLAEGLNLPEKNRDIKILDLLDEKNYIGEGENLTAGCYANDLAYIIYTSGTTGIPKGVMIEHRNVVRLLFNAKMPFDFGQEDIWTLFHSFCFDFSVWEMYGALLYGGRLVIVPKSRARETREFLKLLKEENVTVLNQTPTAFYHLIHADLEAGGEGLGLRYVIFGGEALKPAMLKPFKEKYPCTSLINMYGITETTVHVTFKEIGKCEIEQGSSNIGKPLPTLTTYIMDKDLCLLPVGVPGEICVGGLGVGRGYLNRPQLMEEKFVYNPYKPEERLYRSGDLAKLLLNGEMEYLGRIDHQVKIRGFRVELGEIESKLLENEIVKEVVVVDGEDAKGNKYLSAYMVTLEEFTVADMRDFVSKVLPDYMIPTYFVRLTHLPLTSNGKVDRKNLPNPLTNLDTGTVYVAPRNEIEEYLVKIWEEVLGAKETGIMHNFFELGGDSIKAIQVSARLYKYKLKMEVRDLFRHPVIAELSGYIKPVEDTGKDGLKEILSPLQKWYLQQNADGDDPVNRETLLNLKHNFDEEIQNIYPLTPMQEGMLFHWLMDKSSTAYFEQMAFTILGEIDLELFEKSFNAIIKRYDVLRTLFIYEHVDAPLQVVLKERPAKLHFENIFHLDTNSRNAFIDDFKERDRKRGFDLSMDRLIRLSVFKESNMQSRVIWSFHHILMDGWCIGIVVRDFFEIYQNLKAGTELIISEMPSVYSYSSFIEWLLRQDYDEAYRYWRTYLSGYDQQAVLPKDGRTSDPEAYEAAETAFRVDEELTKGLEKIAMQNHVTLNTVFQVFWGLILARYNNTDDVVFGAVVSGRPPEIQGIEGMVGLFINTLPVRVKFDGDMTFRSLVVKQQEAALISEKYSYAQLARIQADSGHVHRLIDNIIAFENFPVQKEIGNTGQQQKLGFEISDVEVREEINYDFGIMVVPGEALLIKLSYNAKVYDRGFVENIQGHFKEAMRSVLSNPEIKMDEIEIVPSEERNRLISEFNRQPDLVYLESGSLKELFEEQAEKSPDSMAIIFENQSITYGQLNEHSNKVANMLIHRGITGGHTVALMMERSIEMAVGLIGILKSGGAFLPLDPMYPEERIKYMLEDSEAGVVLCGRGTLHKVPAGKEIVFIDDGEGESCGNPKISINLSSPAYVIYTSGTTGKPKGVVVEHGSLSKTIQWRRHEYGMDGNDTVLQLFSYSFDGFLTSFFTPVVSGSRILLPNADQARDPLAIKAIAEFKNVTHFISIPAFFSQILECMDASDLRNLKTITLAGDKTIPQVVIQSREKNPGIELINEYGPTEGSVVATIYRNMDAHSTTVIGKPVAETKIFVLNRSGRLQPVGVPGELCIAGSRLARGYLNLPGLTKEKFTSFEGERIYKTGDLARWMKDGNLEFMGRVDQQVKVRGFRIEPAEIENAVLACDTSIKEVVVVNRHGENSLCAFFVSPTEVDISLLRKDLSNTLPDYMIPSYFVQMEKIPLLQNGKVDRKALPEPEVYLKFPEMQKGPVSEEQKTLLKVWEEVLGIENIGIGHNFFELGGDSIKAIQVSSRLYKYGLKLEVKDIFRYPRIEELSGCVLPLERQYRQDVVSGFVGTTPIQEWFFEMKLNEPGHFNQAVMLYREEGFDEELIKKVFTSIVFHHDALRMVLRYDGGTVKPYIMGTEGELFTLDILELKGEKPDSRIEEESNRLQQGIDLDKGPLIKLGLFKTDEGDHLLVVIHHLVIDGVSWRILFEDFASGYMQLLENKEIEFQPKTSSVSEWAESLAVYASSPELMKEAEYWRMLEDTEFVPLPVDRIALSNQVSDSAQVTSMLTEEETKKLTGSVNKAFNTEINDILLTALAISISKWTGGDKILVNLEGHGREEVVDTNVARTVGWFTTAFPVVLGVSDQKETDVQSGLSNAIRNIKESLRSIPHKGIGYGVLKYLTPKENRPGLDFALQPEISFNYLGQFDADINTGVFGISRLGTGQPAALDMPRLYRLDINGMIAGGRLMFYFNFNRNEYDNETMEQLAESFRSSLAEIIAYCQSRTETLLSPSDLTYKKLTIEKLDKLCLAIKDQVEMAREHDRNRLQIKNIYPLTPMQEGMLLYSTMNGKSKAYFEQVTFTLEGNVDIELLKQSFDVLFERHDVLRTVFVYEDAGHPLQIVFKERYAEVLVEDVSFLDEEERTKYIEDFKKKDRERGFVLSGDFLMRLALLKEAVNTYRTVWSFHHILMDGWCMEILIKEFFEAYQGLKNKALSRNNASLRLGAVRSYGNYIEWLTGQDRESARQYFQNYLADYEKRVFLLQSANSAAVDGKYEKEEAVLQLDETVTFELEKIAKMQKVTLNTVFQALWGLLLRGYNDTGDVVFGQVVSGRDAGVAGIESMVGLFINTVPVRIHYENRTFPEVLREVQEAASLSNRYSYMPLSEIQAATSLKQGLIDHIIVFDNFPVREEVESQSLLNNLGLAIRNYEVSEQTEYDFNVIVLPGRKLTVKFIYNSLVYDKAAVETIGVHLKQLTATVINNPGIHTGSIGLASREEMHKIWFEFNDTDVGYQRNQTLNRLFEEQVEKTPDAVAVVFDGWKTTYRELNLRANCLAEKLKHALFGKKEENGITLDGLKVVAVIAERSPRMITGILAVLKAGAAFLPVDPQYPAQRIKTMLEDSKAFVVLSEAELDEEIGFEGAVLDLGDTDLWERYSTNPENVNTASDVLYVIYTSGTTGKPKGVMITHRNLNNLIHFEYNFTKIDFKQKVLQFTSNSFDVCYQEVFSTLLCGGELHIVKNEIRQDAAELLEFIGENGVQVVFLPTSYLKMLMSLDDYDAFPGCIKHIITAGEQLIVHDRFRDYLKSKGVFLHNHYGPSETHVVTTYTMDPCGDIPEKPPIGKPVSNTRIFILNKDRQIQPVGVPGELYISGDSVGRGYINRPELTDEKFLTDVCEKLGFTAQQAGRMYKTGDIARWLPDGNLEFLGRLDHQVKIRGFRVEPGEIEARLLQHEAVKEAFVTVKVDTAGDKYLTAYFVPEGNLEGQALKEYLSDSLPDHMIPACFVSISRMPLTPNGKIDKSALPEPAFDQGNALDLPRNGTEVKLLEIWNHVLGVERIGVRDNFFTLGGHSLKATLLTAKIRRELKVELPLIEVFNKPTVREQADFVKEAKEKEFIAICSGTVREALEGKSYPKGCYPLSYQQKRIYILSQLEGAGTSYNIPGALRIEGLLDENRLEEAFRKLIQRHEVLRTSFLICNGEPVQCVHDEVDFTISTSGINQMDGLYDIAAGQQNSAGQCGELSGCNSSGALSNEQTFSEESYKNVKLVEAFHDFVQPFDLKTAPLLRVRLIRVSQKCHILLYDLHHIICDGTSMSILVKDLTEIYKGMQLSNFGIQYKEYAMWQRTAHYATLLKEQETYWTKALEGDIPALNLPSDFIRPPVQSFDGDRILLELDRQTTSGLKKLAKEHGCTLFMVLLSVYGTLLMKCTGQEDFVIGTNVAGRNHADLENVMGMFVNTLAIRSFPSPHKRFRDFLEEVKMDSIKAFAASEYQFDQLVEKLRLQKDPSRNAVFDTMLVLQNHEAVQLNLEGLSFTAVSIENYKAKVDLSLFAVEEDGRIGMCFEYCTAIFKRESIEKMGRRFADIALEVLNNPDMLLSDVDTSRTEKTLMLGSFNDELENE